MHSFWRVSVSRVLGKFFFVLVCGVLGSFIYDYMGWYYPGLINWLGVFVGLMAGGGLVALEYICRRIPARYLISAILAGLISLLATRMLREILMLLEFDENLSRKLCVAGFFGFSYICLWVLIYTQEEYQFVIPFVRLHSTETSDKDIILDTSVIIDGRIADMCNTTFLNGRLIIPRFVLKELQDIADSSDPLKRNRGRRGLEVLNRIKENSRLKVKIQETDFPQINTVDAKLVKLAATINGRVFTNDYNLSKVAELQNVEILNINELANLLKPVVLPGELLEVKIIKEGKESNQGVAYLDDGTMVVVENGRRLIGRVSTVVVTSAYQTQAGRMIFAKSDRDR